MAKLSARAWEILLTIDERSIDPAGKFKALWWSPGELRGMSDKCDRLNRHININGAGDARIIESLTVKGLIRRNRELHPYASQITEDGRLTIEQAIESGSIPLELTY